mmetsp:Transcript_68469/g.182441  ORF Transcript_68469/g.182441 Transcript_68469/m.182441 type:complete len:80 (-) Transcript_68469:222-461(-)
MSQGVFSVQADAVPRSTKWAELLDEDEEMELLAWGSAPNEEQMAVGDEDMMVPDEDPSFTEMPVVPDMCAFPVLFAIEA